MFSGIIITMYLCTPYYSGNYQGDPMLDQSKLTMNLNTRLDPIPVESYIVPFSIVQKGDIIVSNATSSALKWNNQPSKSNKGTSHRLTFVRALNC